MRRSGIPYLTHSWPIFSGCWNWRDGFCAGDGSQFYCWAKAQTERFKTYYPHGFEPTIYWERLNEPKRQKKGVRVGVAFMGDLFGMWPAWGKEHTGWRADFYIPRILEVVRDCPQHTFLFLTKRPENLAQFNPWPPNAEVGTTVTCQEDANRNLIHLAKVQAATRWVSLEPLLGPVDLTPWLGWRREELDRLPAEAAGLLVTCGRDKRCIDWLVLGGSSRPKRYPKEAWVRAIEDAADAAGVAVFEKSNLYPAGKKRILRQEYPKEVKL